MMTFSAVSSNLYSLSFRPEDCKRTREGAQETVQPPLLAQSESRPHPLCQVERSQQRETAPIPNEKAKLSNQADPTLCAKGREVSREKQRLFRMKKQSPRTRRPKQVVYSCEGNEMAKTRLHEMALVLYCVCELSQYVASPSLHRNGTQDRKL